MKIVLSTIDLITRFRSGDEVATRQLYNLHYQPLCYYSEKLIHDKGESEDIAVEVFLKLLAKKNDFYSLAEIKAFLFVATRNACFDYLRKLKRLHQSHAELQYLFNTIEDVSEGEMINAKVLQLIYAEVESLPFQCKKIFTSIFFESKSTSQVASEMELSTQTVLNQKAKAIQKLKLTLQQAGFISVIVLLLSFIAPGCQQQYAISPIDLRRMEPSQSIAPTSLFKPSISF